MKQCSKCSEVKPVEMFAKNKSNKDGLSPKCKQCQKEYINKWKIDNPRDTAEYLKQWRINNPGKHKQYYKQNKEVFKASTKKWVENNKDRWKAYCKGWIADNKEQHTANLDKNTHSIEPGVYMVKNQITGERYIGQSIIPYNRRSHHFSNWKSESKLTNKLLQEAMQKYGQNSFVFGIIEHCEPEQLLEREQYYINQLKPEYNLK